MAETRNSLFFVSIVCCLCEPLFFTAFHPLSYLLRLPPSPSQPHLYIHHFSPWGRTYWRPHLSVCFWGSRTGFGADCSASCLAGQPEAWGDAGRACRWEQGAEQENDLCWNIRKINDFAFRNLNDFHLNFNIQIWWNPISNYLCVKNRKILNFCTKSHKFYSIKVNTTDDINICWTSYYIENRDKIFQKKLTF